MASIVNKPTACATLGTNVGQPKGCVLKLENIVGFMLAYDGFKIPVASQDTFDEVLTYLQTASLAADPNERLYYLPMIQDFTDNTPAPEKKTSGFGQLTHVFEQPHSFEVRIENLGIEFHKRLRGFNGRKDLRMYVVTDEAIGGYIDSNGDFLPFEATFFAKQPKLGKVTGDPTMYMAEIELRDPKALSENLSAIAIPDGIELPDEIGGITDVTITATGGAGTVSITAVESISNVDFITKYETEILENGNFLIDNVPEASVSITNGVALFTGISAGTHTVKLNINSDLIVGGIGSLSKGGYESNEVTVTVTAP